MTNMQRRRSEIANSALSALSATGRLCKKYLDDDETPVLLEELNKCVEKHCTLDLNSTAHKNALQKTEAAAQKAAENKSKFSVSAKYKEILDKEKLTLNRNSVAQHRFMIQYLRDIEEGEIEKDNETGDDDLVTSNSFTPPIDPITKAAIKNPVRNKQCGHVYENETIRMLMSKKNTRCPYIGCPALQYIQVSYLVADDNLKRRIDDYFLNN